MVKTSLSLKQVQEKVVQMKRKLHADAKTLYQVIRGFLEQLLYVTFGGL